jgi:predicted PurR-regulated permease PerM
VHEATHAPASPADSGRADAEPDRPAADDSPPADGETGRGDGASPGTAQRSGIGALRGILALLTVASLYLAAPVVVPVVLALLFSFALYPVERLLARLHVPRGVAAAVIIAVFFSLLALFLYGLAVPAEDWFRRLPSSLAELEQKLHGLRGPIEQMREAGESVEQLADLPDGEEAAPRVEVAETGFLSQAALFTTSVFVAGVLTVFTTFFFLTYGSDLARRVVRLGGGRHPKTDVADIIRSVQQNLSRYLVAVATINGLLGVVTGALMWAWGMPEPVLWGAMTALLNFAPYVGPVVTTAVLGLVAAMTFESLAKILLVPATFLVLTAIEGYLITPIVLGRRMTLSPLVIFLAVIFWGWIWGVIGGLVAVPVSVSF